jgi:hypothetical protein
MPIVDCRCPLAPAPHRTSAGGPSDRPAFTARLVVLAACAVIVTGCATTDGSGPGRYEKVGLRNCEKIAPTGYGTDLKEGTRAAIVAFNTEVVAGRGTVRTGGKRTARMSTEELRALSDAMLHAFVSEFSTIPDLKLFPVKHVEGNEFYRLLGYPRGALASGFMLVRGNGQKVAPRGLKYIPVPRSELEQSHGLLSLRDTFSNSRHDFEGNMGHLARALEVDLVILVNNKVIVRDGFTNGYGAALTLMEVIIAGFESTKRYVFAKQVRGAFADETAVGADTVSPAMSELMQPAEGVDFSTTDFAENRYWRTLAVPYRGICKAYRNRIVKIRR